MSKEKSKVNTNIEKDDIDLEKENAVEEETCEKAEDNEKDSSDKTSSETADEDTEKKETDSANAKIEELNDKYKRLFAEFDNFRKRTDLEKAGMFGEGEKTILLKVLPLIDNFERALDHIPEDKETESFAEGIKMIYKQFMDIMTEAGVTQIESVGQPFNADFHNAVMHVEDEEKPENTVVEEFQKGYMFKDKVLRYAMVKVAN